MITAYTLTKKMHNLLTNEVEVNYHFRLKSNDIKPFAKTFKSPAEAEKYLNQEMQDWFMIALEDYVTHARKVIEGGKHTDQDAALQICWSAYESFFSKPLATVAQRFLKGYEYFIKILPHQNNTSYESSIHNLTELRKFCDWFLKHIGLDNAKNGPEVQKG